MRMLHSVLLVEESVDVGARLQIKFILGVLSERVLLLECTGGCAEVPTAIGQLHFFALEDISYLLFELLNTSNL